MTTAWAVMFLLVSLPFCIWCAAFDLTQMKIPNWVNLGLFLAFLLLAPFAFTLPEIGLRVLQAAVMLAVGWALTTFLSVGGGDSKFAAAAAAYVAPSDYGAVILILAVLSLLSVAGHRMLGRMSSLRSITADWASYSNNRKFPFGLPLAATLIYYNALQVL